MVVGGCWLVVGWGLVDGGWWLVVGGWWLVVGLLGGCVGGWVGAAELLEGSPLW